MDLSDLNKVIYADCISWTKLNDEIFVFNEITDEIYLLRGFWKDFWLLLENDSDIYTITYKLASMYKESFSIIKSKVLRKVYRYIEEEILIWS